MPTIGPYEILGELGRGGMGVVYRARRADLGREFALKVIGAGVGSSSAFGTPNVELLVARFRREAQAGGRLAGIPGLVAVHDIGEAPGPQGAPVLYLAMDLIDGRSLDAVIAEGELTPAQAAAVVAQAARAVHVAHERGVLHRDLKPANILVEAGDRAWVTDFGLARTTAAGPELTRLTTSGELLGTPAYMPPEQARGEPCDARADVYGLGACLYEALAGVAPFRGDSVYRVVAQVLRDPPPPLRRVAPHVPEALERVVACALAKAPDERYATAAALAADCEAFVAGRPVLARRPRGAGGRRRAALALAAVAGLGIAAAGVAWWARGGAAASAAPAGVAAGRTQAEQAATVNGAWFALSAATREPLERLADHWNGVWLPDAELPAVLARLDGAIEAAAVAHPGTRQPAVLRAMGRWLAAVRDQAQIDAALAALEAAADAPAGDAVADDPFPHVIAARALLAHWARELNLPRSTQTETGVVLDPLSESDRLQGLRARAQAALRRAAASPLWPHLTTGRATLDLAAAVDALSARHHAAAAERLGALRDDPFLQRDARRLRGVALYAAGAWPEAAAEFEALDHHGWFLLAMAAGHAWSAAAQAAAHRGEPAEPLFERARAAFDREAARLPDPGPALGARGLMQVARGRVLSRDGADPRPAYAAAEADIERALATAGDRAGNLGVRANARLELGVWLERREEDGRAPLRAAIEDLEAALAADPASRAARLNLPSAREALARAEERRGADPRPLLREVLADFAALIADEPEFAPHRLNRSGATTTLARAEARAGEDPRPSYEAAIAELRAALDLAPDYALAAQNQGRLEVEVGRYLERRGGDAAPRYRAAVACYDRALAIRGNDHESLGLRGVARRALADLQDAAGQDPRAELEAALADYAAAVRLVPGDPAVRYNQGNALRACAEAAARWGGDATVHRQAAADAYRAALAADARFWRAAVNLGVVLEELGDVASAVTAYERALTLNPSLDGARERLALLRGR